MHLLLMMRGITHNFELVKHFLETQMFWWKREPLLKDEKGNFIQEGVDENGQPKYRRGEPTLSRVQGSLRPIQLFEYVFPEKGMKVVNGKLEEDDNLLKVLAAMKYANQKLRPEVNSVGWMLRKMAGFKKLPDYPQLATNPNFQMLAGGIEIPGDRTGVAIYPLGIRKDVTQDFIFNTTEGKQGFHQEGL